MFAVVWRRVGGGGGGGAARGCHVMAQPDLGRAFQMVTISKAGTTDRPAST